jgi:hypothetical protein
MRSCSGFLVFAATLVFTVPAAAQDDVEHTVSITISPIHLISPIVELTGEYRVADNLGVAAVLGGGRVSAKSTSGAITATGSAFEIGAQARYYVLGSFIHGMQLGAEVLYARVSLDSGSSSIAAAGDGLELAPFIGYKIASNIGFTFDAQLGYGYLLGSASANDSSTGASESASASTGMVLLNLNVGWSF